MIQLDQTLRNALGMPYDFEEREPPIRVDLAALDLSLKQILAGWASSLFGRRFLFFRLCKAFVPDLEKRIARLPEDAFAILGTDLGLRIVCEVPVPKTDGRFRLVSRSVKAFVVTADMIREREAGELRQPRRYAPAHAYLYPEAGLAPGGAQHLEPDIPRIFLDAHFRLIDVGADHRELSPFTPIRVRRELVDVVWKQLQDFGFTFLISLSVFTLTVLQAFELSFADNPIAVAALFTTPVVVLAAILALRVRRLVW